MSTYERALLDVGDMSGATQLVIYRLKNPDQRVGVLIAVQDYVDSPQPKHVVELRNRWRSLINDPDVRAAITRVGTMQHFDVDSPGTY